MKMKASKTPALTQRLKPVSRVLSGPIIRLVIGLVATWQSPQAFAIDVFAYAEPSQPVKTFSYTSTATGAQEWVMNATVVESPSDPETVNGQLYQVRIQETRGIDGYDPDDLRIFYAERKDGLYTGFYDAKGSFTEYLQIPANVGIGDAWPDPSGYWDSASLDSIAKYQSAAGEFSDCLHITRKRSIQGPPDQQMTNSSIHCPGIGQVHSTVEHAFEGFHSITEMELVDIDREGHQ